MSVSRILVGVLVLAGSLLAQQPAATATATVEVQAAKKAYVQKSLYPLTTCVVSGEELEGDGVKVFEAGGRTFKTCCGKCQKKVEADPAPFAAKLDAAIVAQQLASYPLEVCPVSGKKLGSMGDPIQLVLDGTLVQLCCKGCVKKANAGAAEIVARIHDAAYAAQKAVYPLKTCVVSDEKLGDDAVDVMYGETLVRFCCKSCTGDFEKDPATFLAKIAAAKGSKQAPAEAAEPKRAPAAMAGSCCGTECVESATGGSCCEKAKASEQAKPAAKSCCDTTTEKPAPQPAPAKVEPPKKIG